MASEVTSVLSRDAMGKLVLAIPGGDVVADVTPVRCFPLADPHAWVSFLDAEGREAWCVRDPAALDSTSRKLLDEELARREFIPEIKQIHAVTTGADPTTWHVETDRGETTFRLPSEDAIRRLGRGAILTDEHGVRFRVVDAEALDKASRAHLRRWL